MGSKRPSTVWFISSSDDHLPPHVYGEYGETIVIIDLLPEGNVARSERKDAVQPGNAKRRDVKRILDVEAEHASESKDL